MLPMEAFFSSPIFLFLQFSFEGKTEYVLLTKMNMLTLREQQRFQVTQTCDFYDYIK